ncbi:hypothetical protein LSAT2_014435 [Lamellibrachia satsuma]|nr:hypothetical protein LSAT2_014435 [Lamellibrachia satsuma]
MCLNVYSVSSCIVAGPGVQPQGSKASLSSEVGIVIILGVSATTALFILAAGILYIRRRARDTQAHHVTPQLLFPDDTGPSQQCYVANAAFRCTKRRAGTSTDNIDDKCNYACEMTVDSSYGSRRNCNEPLTNPSPKPRPVPDSRVRYKVVGYPGNMNTFKQPRAPRSDTDASREVHGFTACRYSRCRSRDDGDVIDLTGTLLNAK